MFCLQGNGIDRADTAGCNGAGWREDVSYTLNTIDRPAVVYENHSQDCRYKELTDVSESVTAKYGTGGNNMPVVVAQNWDGSQVAPTLTSHNAGGSQRMPDKGNFNAVVAYTTGQTPQADERGVGFTLRARDYKDPQGVAYGLDRACFNQGKNAKYNFSIEEEKIGAQVARGPGAVFNSVVRRLTPLECERLQGFPDGWTDIGDWVDSKGKLHKSTDSARYKALGNSIALPFWDWLAARIVAQYDRPTTMASLFDGIGGFPLVFSHHGCMPVWASEIEEFPIAVTKKRFADEH